MNIDITRNNKAIGINKYLVLFLFTIFVFFYGLFPYYAERLFYLNELFSLIGFIIFLKKPILFRRNDSIYNIYIVLLMYSLTYLVLSWFVKDNAYVYFRNSVIVYSMFVFFLGYYAYDYLQYILFGIKRIVKALLLVIVTVKLPINRVSVLPLLPIFANVISRRWFVWLIALDLLVAYSYGGSTSIAVLVGQIYIMLFKSFRGFLINTVLLVFIGVYGFYTLVDDLSLIYYGGLVAVMESNDFFHIDGNFTTRLILWYQVLVGLYPRNMVGIGFGTPLFDSKYLHLTTNENKELLAYVLGSHNSYITLFARLGIGYVILMGILNYFIFKKYYFYKKLKMDKEQIIIYMSFVAITVCAMLNVVLESPIHSSLYWIIIGLLARSIYCRKINNI